MAQQGSIRGTTTIDVKSIVKCRSYQARPGGRLPHCLHTYVSIPMTCTPVAFRHGRSAITYTWEGEPRQSLVSARNQRLLRTQSLTWRLLGTLCLLQLLPETSVFFLETLDFHLEPDVCDPVFSSNRSLKILDFGYIFGTPLVSFS